MNPIITKMAKATYNHFLFEVHYRFNNRDEDFCVKELCKLIEEHINSTEPINSKGYRKEAQAFMEDVLFAEESLPTGHGMSIPVGTLANLLNAIHNVDRTCMRTYTSRHLLSMFEYFHGSDYYSSEDVKEFISLCDEKKVL